MLDVLVEINVGANHCAGWRPGEPAVALARKIKSSDHLRFAGLQAYHGSAQHIRRVDERRAAIEKAVVEVRSTRGASAGGGHRVSEEVTGAGTGTYVFEAREHRVPGETAAGLVHVHGRRLRAQRVGARAAYRVSSTASSLDAR